jgi:REP element-mobilizing transposase RayT
MGRAKRNPSHLPESSVKAIPNYRRNFLRGGSYFFMVNLADRRLGLLAEHISLLRAAFRCVRARHPFTIEAAVILPDHLHAIWKLPSRLFEHRVFRDLGHAGADAAIV